MKYFIFVIVTIFITGCINKQGISASYYDDCYSYYDLYGQYKENCPKNFINFHKKKKSQGECLQCK